VKNGTGLREEESSRSTLKVLWLRSLLIVGLLIVVDRLVS
jgi:hypothetical protein